VRFGKDKVLDGLFGDGGLEKIRSVGISGVGNGRLLRGHECKWVDGARMGWNRSVVTDGFG